MADVDVEDDRGRKIPVVNPLALPSGRYVRERLFRMWAGAHAPTYGYVWADSFDSAFEEWVEYLDDHAPGMLTSLDENDYKHAAQDLGIPWKSSWPDWEDSQFTEVAEAAEADLTVIGHTTLKHGTHIASWEWGGDEIDHGEEYDSVWQACAEAYEAEYDKMPEPPKGVTPPKSQKRMKLKLDGVEPQRRPAWTIPPRRK